MRIQGVHHVAIKAADPEALARFYRDVLRLPEEARHEDEHGLRSIWLTLGDSILMIERVETGDRTADRPTTRFDRDPQGRRPRSEPPASEGHNGRSQASALGTVRVAPSGVSATLGPAGEFTSPMTGQSGLHLLALAIAPEDRSAWRAHLEARGHPIVLETAYTIYVQDPDGNRVGLSHWPHGG